MLKSNITVPKDDFDSNDHESLAKKQNENEFENVIQNQAIKMIMQTVKPLHSLGKEYGDEHLLLILQGYQREIPK